MDVSTRGQYHNPEHARHDNWEGEGEEVEASQTFDRTYHLHKLSYSMNEMYF